MTSIVIENIHNIHINLPQQRNPMVEALLKSIFAGGSLAAETDEEVREGASVAIELGLTPPRIGEYWHSQGGIYAGLARGEDGQPDYHLILAEAAPETRFTWEAAKAHAKTIVAGGHRDFALPTRLESALLYANLHDKISTDHWHWTGTEHSAGRAFRQFFDNGNQLSNYVSFEARARFVRRLIL
jgi:hypothetical protein